MTTPATDIDAKKALLKKTHNAALDDLGKAARTVRKMINRAKTKQESDQLVELLKVIHRQIEQAADKKFHALAHSDKIDAVTKDIADVTKKLKAARKKMTTAAKTIEQVNKVINIVGTALEGATALLA